MASNNQQPFAELQEELRKSTKETLALQTQIQQISEELDRIVARREAELVPIRDQLRDRDQEVARLQLELTSHKERQAETIQLSNELTAEYNLLIEAYRELQSQNAEEGQILGIIEANRVLEASNAHINFRNQQIAELDAIIEHGLDRMDSTSNASQEQIGHEQDLREARRAGEITRLSDERLAHIAQIRTLEQQVESQQDQIENLNLVLSGEHGGRLTTRDELQVPGDQPEQVVNGRNGFRFQSRNFRMGAADRILLESPEDQIFALDRDTLEYLDNVHQHEPLSRLGRRGSVNDSVASVDSLLLSPTPSSQDTAAFINWMEEIQRRTQETLSLSAEEIDEELQRADTGFVYFVAGDSHSSSPLSPTFNTARAERTTSGQSSQLAAIAETIQNVQPTSQEQQSVVPVNDPTAGARNTARTGIVAWLRNLFRMDNAAARHFSQNQQQMEGTTVAEIRREVGPFEGDSAIDDLFGDTLLDGSPHDPSRENTPTHDTEIGENSVVENHEIDNPREGDTRPVHQEPGREQSPPLSPESDCPKLLSKARGERDIAVQERNQATNERDIARAQRDNFRQAWDIARQDFNDITAVRDRLSRERDQAMNDLAQAQDNLDQARRDLAQRTGERNGAIQRIQVLEADGNSLRDVRATIVAATEALRGSQLDPVFAPTVAEDLRRLVALVDAAVQQRQADAAEVARLEIQLGSVRDYILVVANGLFQDPRDNELAPTMESYLARLRSAAQHSIYRIEGLEAELDEREQRAEEFKATAVNNQNTAMAQRDAATNQRDAAIAERDAAINGRDAAQVARNRAIDDRTIALQERGDSITERNNARSERDTAIEERNTARAERDDAQEQLEIVNVELSAAVTRSNEQLADHQAEVNEITEGVADLCAEIEALRNRRDNLRRAGLRHGSGSELGLAERESDEGGESVTGQSPANERRRRNEENPSSEDGDQIGLIGPEPEEQPEPPSRDEPIGSNSDEEGTDRGGDSPVIPLPGSSAPPPGPAAQTLRRSIRSTRNPAPDYQGPNTRKRDLPDGDGNGDNRGDDGGPPSKKRKSALNRK